MNLIGKTVKIPDTGLLEFFYPEFYVRKELIYDPDMKVIYIGASRSGLSEYLARNTKEFISTVGVCDIDLEERETLLSFVYSKHGKSVSDTVIEMLKSVPQHEFFTYIKKYWVMGSSKMDKAPDTTIFDLYVALSKKAEAFSVYLVLSEFFDDSMILSSILTFFEKALDPETEVSSPRYARILQDFRKTHSEKLNMVLLSYFKMRESNNFKLRWLLYQF
jgi:hypothetical protein